MPESTLNLGVRGASCVVSWPTRLVLCAPDRRAIFIPSTDCPRHNSVFLACRKSDHLQQLTDCPKDSLVFLACRKTCHTRVSNMDRDACTCRLKQHLGFAQPTNPLRLLTPGGLAMIHIRYTSVTCLSARQEYKTVFWAVG